MSWILGILKWLLSLWLKTPLQPSQEAVQAKEAGAATETVVADEKALTDVQTARVASDTSIRKSTSDPSSLRMPDPDSRD